MINPNRCSSKEMSRMGSQTAFSRPRPARKNMTPANWANTGSMNPTAPIVARPVLRVANPATTRMTMSAKQT